MARLSPMIRIVLGLLLGAAACTGPTVTRAGAPPDQWGFWAVWSPDADTEVGDEAGVELWTRHRLASDAFERGETLDADRLEQLPSSLNLELFVTPVDPPAVTGVRLLAVCGPWRHHERTSFDPPLVVGSDGTIAPDPGVVTWEGRLTGSARFEGTWSADRCGGSWDGDGDGAGPVEAGWARFYPEERLERPWYAVVDWGVELTTRGRHPERNLDLCVEAAFDQPSVDLDAWLELQFGRGGFLPGDVALDCGGDGAHLVVDVRGRTAVGSYGLDGNRVHYWLTATVDGTVALRHEDHPPLTAGLIGSSRTLVSGDDPPEPIIESLYRDALACGLSPVFASWWGTDQSDPVPIVHPFFDPPRCTDPDRGSTR